jgi:uncharacterized membrane protein
MKLILDKRLIAATFITAVFLGGSVTIADVGPLTINPLRIIVCILSVPALLWLLNSILGRYRGLTIYYLSMGAMGFYAILSLAWTESLSDGLQVVSYIVTAQVIVITILSHYSWIQKNIVFLYKVLIVNLLFICALGFLEIATGVHFFASRELASVAAGKRLAGILGWNVPIVFEGNPNNLALMCVLFLVILYGLRESVFHRLSPFFRALAYIAMFGLVAIVILTGSRAAIGGLLTAMGLLAAFAVFRQKKALGLVPVMAMGAGVAVAFYMTGNILSYLIDKNTAEGSGGLGVRSEYYANAVLAMLDSYGMGSGAGSYIEWNDGRSYHYHFLEVLADFGLLIFVLHTLVFVIPAIRYFSNAGRSARNIAFGVSLVVLPILMFGPSSLYAQPSFWMWFSIIALFSREVAFRGHK